MPDLWGRVNRGDVAFGVLLACAFLVEVLLESRFSGHRVADAVVAAGFAATLLARRVVPLVPLVALVAVIEYANLFASPLGDTATLALAFALVIYSAARHTTGGTTLVAVAFVVLAVPLAAIEPAQPFVPADAAFIVVLAGVPFAAGVVQRRRGAALAVAAEQAVAADRARIARELHDVVSHAIGVILLQARGGRAVVEGDPARAGEALGVIEYLAGEALDEMRRLVAMRDVGSTETSWSPQPGLARLPDLVAGFSGTGVEVDLRVEGTVVPLPPGIDLAAYRIVQEALTNVLKHSGAAHTSVVVRYRPTLVEVEVADDGRGGAAGGGSGRGLAGIRERVSLYDGEVVAGQDENGGYRLRARLPVRTAS